MKMGRKALLSPRQAARAQKLIEQGEHTIRQRNRLRCHGGRFTGRCRANDYHALCVGPVYGIRSSLLYNSAIVELYSNYIITCGLY